MTPLVLAATLSFMLALGALPRTAGACAPNDGGAPAPADSLFDYAPMRCTCDVLSRLVVLSCSKAPHRERGSDKRLYALRFVSRGAVLHYNTSAAPGDTLLTCAQWWVLCGR